jgi:hypothetical protein
MSESVNQPTAYCPEVWSVFIVREEQTRSWTVAQLRVASAIVSRKAWKACHGRTPTTTRAECGRENDKAAITPNRLARWLRTAAIALINAQIVLFD